MCGVCVTQKLKPLSQSWEVGKCPKFLLGDVVGLWGQEMEPSDSGLEVLGAGEIPDR